MSFNALRCLLLSALTPAVQAGGVTLITHGFNGDVDSWILPMAERIKSRGDFPGNDLSCYVVEVTGSDGNYTTNATRVDGPAPADSDTGEIVVKLDWSAIAGLGSTGTSSTDVAEAAADALLSTTLIPENGGRALAELPLHLAGHSRGASVVSEISRLLGQEGVWVDQLTLWDPVPVSLFGDADVEIWENVLFADNYYQRLGAFLDPQGNAHPGAYNRQLLSLSGGYSSNHSDVHLWYHGTVETGTPASDTQETITASERSSWWTTAEGQGSDTGFLYSRLAGGDRLSTATPGGAGLDRIVDGYNQLWDLGAGLSTNRTALPSAPADPWPNAIVASLGTTGPVSPGDPLSVEVRYQSEQSGAGDPTLSVLLDPDPNPWNGNETEASSGVVPGSGSAMVLSASPAALVPAGLEGSYHLVVRIEEGGRTRYLPLAGTLEVSAGAPVLSIVAGSLRVEGGLFTFTIAGDPGSEVTVEATMDLEDWETLDTVTLTTGTLDFSDSGSASLPRRFYRVGTP